MLTALEKEAIEKILANLKKNYTGDRFTLDCEVAQLLSGNFNKAVRQKIILYVSGESLSADRCTVAAVTDAIKTKFDQLQLF
jgi:hypothetical protein